MTDSRGVRNTRYGVIDVGTNTIRLLVSEIVDGMPMPIVTDKVLIRLGRDVDRDGRFSEETIGQAVRTLARFVGRTEEFGCDHLRVIGTSASREAENGGDFAARAKSAIGMELEIIDEDEEARLAFVGAMNALVEPWEGDVGVVDVGGGSTEIVVGSHKQGIGWSHSYRLGSGRLTDLYIEHDPPTPVELRRVRRAIEETLPAVGEVPHPQHATAVAGSASNLRRMVGPLLDLEALNRALRLLCDEPADLVGRAFGIDPERARLLPAGAMILHAVQVRLGEPLWFSKGGIREGAVLEMARG